jgi:eukaryotic-like serine/threonine-protein kinase
MTERVQDSQLGLSPPDRLGPFRILQVLGEGGMGIVYEAEETGPVRRRVALKVIRAGLASKDVVARFDAERQALAVMNHPGIAKVLQAGETESGQPYFAMELVNGVPITQYCDTRMIPITQRIELFIAVCLAVQHAHMKGVIHRDIKPSNVLVTEHDSGAQPKIIDFGVAKALGHQLTEKTLVTQWGQAIGTAAYMPPEQADSSGIDVDTRADIYSLGVMLYEVLAGRLPVDSRSIAMHVFLSRLVSGEAKVPPPSERLQSLGAERGTIALMRGTDPQHLWRDLRGDLDWIVMKAMDPDRTRRYDTANGLANDLRHYLAHEPIAARPPSVQYRVGKFVRRHRTGVLAASVMTAALLASSVLAMTGMLRATRAERQAQQEASAANAVTNFLVDLFRVSDPVKGRGSTVTAREILDQGTRRINNELTGQPLLRGRILQTMGTVHQALGLYDPANRLLEDALTVRERELGPNHPSVAETLNALGDVAVDKGEFNAAERYYRRALTIREGALGREHIDVGGTLSGLAALRFRQGRNTEAESLYTRVLDIDKHSSKPNERRHAAALMGLAIVYWAQKRYPEAEPLMRQSLSIQERSYGKDHPIVAATLNNLAALNWTLERYADALPLYERARGIFERTHGKEHPYVASVLNNLGEVHWKLQQYEDAEALFRRALGIKERLLTPDHPSIAVTLNGLAGVLRDQRRFAEAEPLYRRALAIREKVLGPQDANVAETLRDLAELMRRSGRIGEAAALEARITGV